jgi:hypothetical protein
MLKLENINVFKVLLFSYFPAPPKLALHPGNENLHPGNEILANQRVLFAPITGTTISIHRLIFPAMPTLFFYNLHASFRKYVKYYSSVRV